MEATKTHGWTGLSETLMMLHLDGPLRRLRERGFLGRILREVRGDEVVLDLGAGVGTYSIEIAKKLGHGKVIALDVSGNMLQRLEEKARVQGVSTAIDTVEADAGSSGLDDESVDLVVSSNLFHELSDPEAAAREIFRVLKPGGCVLVKDFRKTLAWKLLALFHGEHAHGAFDEQELKDLLENAGIEAVSVTSKGAWLTAEGRKEPRTAP
jgi:ubiquinone/menaquinone biosynthesis C-methylase UbiE